MVKNKTVWKQKFSENFTRVLLSNAKGLVVGVDHVGSRQMQQIRQSVRGSATIVMGKNTMIRRILGLCMDKLVWLDRLLPHVSGNVGFVFTNGDLNDVRERLEANKVEAPAKAGTIAPVDVIVPKMNTGLGPEKTSFFQALSIQTKITRGTIEILNDVHIIHKGQKVGPSEASLLKMLKIYPFQYGFQILLVIDEGSVYNPAVLDITQEQIIGNFMTGVHDVAALSLAVDYPTAASVPHTLANTFKDALALCAATQYRCDESAQVIDYLEDPSKFAAAVVAAPSASPTKEAAPAAVDEESESDSDCGMGLFD